MEFGFFPENLDLAHGPVTVSTLPDFSSFKNKVLANLNIRDEWIYPGNVVTMGLGGIRTEPYPHRIFGLPKTHAIEHANANHDSEQLLKFHIWVLSFFVGMRLTSEKAGFLDTTPIKEGKLVDFIVIGQLDRAVGFAEKFWTDNISCPKQTARLTAAIHSLFLSQNPQALRFEQFQYVYMALDACFAMLNQKHKNGCKPNHAKRLSWMCEKFEVPIPTWANDKQAMETEVSGIRNDAFHEALFDGEPFGFAIDGAGSSQNLVLEMQNLTCRILAGILGVSDTQYLTSAVNNRQLHGVRLIS